VGRVRGRRFVGISRRFAFLPMTAKSNGCHFEFSPNFIRHNEKMTEMPKQVRHDVYESFGVH
ncbi:MAG: hypothetical protein ACOCU7_07405, partial [Tangfeifania sp.]